MSERRSEIIRRIYKMFEDITPLDGDCGQLCGGACCRGDEHAGMRLLPGEEELLNGADFLEIHRSGDGNYALCRGGCRRELRPFSCRIFPLFPIITKTRSGRLSVRAMPDIRALKSCALFGAGAPEIDKRFYRAVRRAGLLMLTDRRLGVWLRENGEYIREVALIRAALET